MNPELDKDRLSAVLEVLREQLVPELRAQDIGTNSMTPLKAMVARETLLWRIVELADGVVLCLDGGNSLSAVILARAVTECAAVQHQLNSTIRAAKSMSAVEVDNAIMRLLVGTRVFSTGDPVEDAKIQMTNVQTCLKNLDRKFKGAGKHYEYLCEYAHPNWAGTAGLFSTGDATKGIRKLGRYADETQRALLDEATSSTILAIAMFASDYASIVDWLPDFFEVCDRSHEGAPKT